ncbi:hypothetical protein C5F50_05680 [Nitrosopumilus ureiphilus]|uniref:Uncharacterized protein n=1 Tax=Nitrosopumilus ureiphilus TaxID=1470067 RepID=A0A7D5R618_9ARCH|nr:hypothetical protein C5F50_05680 [Nitrosopumilus ureiphilus]
MFSGSFVSKLVKKPDPEIIFRENMPKHDQIKSVWTCTYHRFEYFKGFLFCALLQAWKNYQR